MGGSASSQLDDSKCTYIRGKTEAVIKNFSPHYSRQYAVAFCNHVRNEVEQQRDLRSQFLKSKPPLALGAILYEAEVSHFAEDVKKWKDRYIVVKNDFAVENYENKEAFQKGASPKSRVLPAGGKVLTSEEEYSLLSDKHFPDPIASSEKENAQPLVILPKEFPVYIWQPYLKHLYYCFPDPEAQKRFSTLLNDCIRHLNHDFLKQTTFEAQAFLEAVQFFRQEKGHYGSWEMITGNEVQILSNLVMEELLPTLQTDLLPKMKGKKNDRKRAWFGIVEETYNLVQDQVSEGLSALKGECETLTKDLEGTVRSDMDQIVNSKDFLAGKIKAVVAEPAEKNCSESIQPFLASILEELMGPVSSGFSEVRSLFEKEVDEISHSFQATQDSAQLKERLDQLSDLPLNSTKMEPCYLKVNLLQEQLQDLKSRFKFPHIDLVIQRTQNFMQELMENAVYTFGQLLSLHRQGDASKTAAAIEKVKLRVLKQYDYDSSTIRKKIFQEALIQITLPTMQKALASTCKPELQKFEQFIFADHTSVIQVENVYEEILHQTLLDETVKVIKEAAILKKHNLFEDNLALPCESVSSLTDLKTPSGSNQASPVRRSSAILPVVSDNEIPSNEVFIEQEKSPEVPEIPEPSVKDESLSTLVPFSSTSFAEQEVVASISDPVESSPLVLVAEEGKEDSLSRNASEIESGQIQEQKSKVQERQSTPPPDCLNEIRDLLTVTIEVPTEAVQENQEETSKKDGIFEDQENELGKEENDPINTESDQDGQNCSEIHEEQCSLSALEMESVDMINFKEAGDLVPCPDGEGVCQEGGAQQGEKEESKDNSSAWKPEEELCSSPEKDQPQEEEPAESRLDTCASKSEEAGASQFEADQSKVEEGLSCCVLEDTCKTQEQSILSQIEEGLSCCVLEDTCKTQEQSILSHVEEVLVSPGPKEEVSTTHLLADLGPEGLSDSSGGKCLHAGETASTTETRNLPEENDARESQESWGEEHSLQ
ncbi:protein Niban 1 [Ornithorhynchus anatinus]|uniref:Niban apoptosis regulator 1 n=1 Tax=Ornithorhynchus anatinus TaxID=9258 RepID=A0A6I8PG86_ORNAN|nr:protein Niban 1 [Ornithorhynchus anatinus]